MRSTLPRSLRSFLHLSRQTSRTRSSDHHQPFSPAKHNIFIRGSNHQPWRFSLPTLLLLVIFSFLFISLLRPFTVNISSTLTLPETRTSTVTITAKPANLTIPPPEPVVNLPAEKPSFDDIFTPLWGHGNLQRLSEGKRVRLTLDRSSGSGFISSSPYQYGVFSASIKLPESAYTAGVVVAFYLSNEDRFPRRHDELDFEFLGSVDKKNRYKWRIQTNVYCNGSVHRGREERYYLWFDPSQDFHQYSIVWSKKSIVFYIDQVPIRVMLQGGNEYQVAYPSKPMSVCTTIWDGSNWATSGGKYRINYEYAPFVSEFKDFDIRGCAVDPISLIPTANCSEKNVELEHESDVAITSNRLMAMKKFRQKYVFYSYCYDRSRYHVLPPECDVIPREEDWFTKAGRLKSAHSSRPHKHRESI